MILDVYYRRGQDTSIDEVKEALPKDMAGLTVGDNHGYPCVMFPRSATQDDLLRVHKVLQDAGFDMDDLYDPDGGRGYTFQIALKGSGEDKAYTGLEGASDIGPEEWKVKAGNLQAKYKAQLESLRDGKTYVSDFGGVMTYGDADRADIDRAYSRIIGLLGLYRAGTRTLPDLLSSLNESAREEPASVQSIYQDAEKECRELG